MKIPSRYALDVAFLYAQSGSWRVTAARFGIRMSDVMTAARDVRNAFSQVGRPTHDLKDLQARFREDGML